MPASQRSLSLHSSARAELLIATDGYAERSATAAGEFVREVERALVRIQESPERYPATRFGARRFVLLKFPFDLAYRILTEGNVELIAVAHHSRRPAYWRRR